MAVIADSIGHFTLIWLMGHKCVVDCKQSLCFLQSVKCAMLQNGVVSEE